VDGTQSVTVLFTDLVGSTELSSSLPPEAADEFRRAHFAALREAVSATGGREVKSLGDGLMVTFDAIAASLSCAVAMQQGIERYGRRSPVPCVIRVGISTGDVTVEEGDYFGDPVVEAARLCAAAHGGQILATEAVKLLARRSGHSFTTERELELKGLPEPVVAWELVWEPSGRDDESRVPLPPRLPHAPAIGLVGRTVELERLTEALKAVASGEPARVVLVAGEPGVGKSTLTSSLARKAHQDGAVVLYGRCDEDLAVPHRPFVEALGHYVARIDDAVLAELGDDHLSALAPLVPELRKRRPGLAPMVSSDPDAERWMLYGAVMALFERAAADAPVVLIVDDLHWADRPTLQLLRHIAGNCTGRLLVLATYRDAELSSSHPLTDTLAALSREQSAVRLSLSGLEDDEVVSFVEAAAGQTLDDAGVGLAHALYQETDGNPFFMAEVLRHLVETHSIIQDDTGRWVPTQELAQAGLPDSVRQVIGSRVGRLGDEATWVLSAAAVLGQEFDVELLASVVGSTEDAVLEVLEAAGSSVLVAEVRGTPGWFRFAHALVQHTLYQDLGATRRARLHRAAAQALEDQLGPDRERRAGELARHWLSATKPAESLKAATYARLAGESALTSLAPAEAVRWFNEALGALVHVADDGERALCLAGLGEAQRQLGEPTYRQSLLEAARVAEDAGDVGTLVRAALSNNRGVMSIAGGVDVERVAVLRTALELLGSADSSARARLLALLALESTFASDLATRRVWADEALAMARRLGDPATLLDVLLRRALAIDTPDTADELLPECIEAEAIADRLGDLVGKFWSRAFRLGFLLQKGEIPEEDRLDAVCTRIASEVGQPLLLWASAMRRSWSYLLAGDHTRAEAEANEALQIALETGQPDVFVFYGAQLLMIRREQGRVGEVKDTFLHLSVDNPGLSPARAMAAFVLGETGRPDEARAMLDDERRLGFTSSDDFLLTVYLDGWANVAVGLADAEAAEILYRRLERWPWLVIYRATGVHGSVAQHLGTLATVLGRYDTAECHFTRALELHERLHAPYWTALTQLEWGRMLLARGAQGDRARAQTMLTSARDTAGRYGFAALGRRSGEALSALG